MAVYVRPFVKSIVHAEECNRRNCGPSCVRVTDGWEYHIKLVLPNGEFFEERKKSPVNGKANSLRYAEERAAHAIRQSVMPLAIGKEETVERGPTWNEFWPRYVVEHCRANRLKPSTIAQKQVVFDHYLKARLGAIPLGETTDSLLARLKADLAHLAPKTVNNVLINVSSPLKAAKEWGVIGRVPCTVKLLKTATPTVEFYEPADYQRIVEAAGRLDPRIELVILLGGDAGFRRGEIIALDQADCDTKRGLLHVRRSEWKGQVTLPKGGRERQVIMTERLKAALTWNRRQGALARRRPRAGHRGAPREVDAAGAAASRAEGHRRASHPAPHLLLSAGDGGRAHPRHQGAGGPPEPHHDDALHAPQPGGEVRRHRPLEQGDERKSGRHAGDDSGACEKPLSRQSLRWSGRQDSTCDPLVPNPARLVSTPRTGQHAGACVRNYWTREGPARGIRVHS
jgi:hypothetical protein